MTTLTFHTYPLPYAAAAASATAAALSSSTPPIPHLIVAAQGEDSDDDGFDPNFFDQDYSIAAQTAFSVWEGAAFLLQFLQRTHSQGQGVSVAASLRQLLRLDDPSASDRHRTRVVELGSGTGAAGIGLAMLGAEVLCTDIKSVTGNICDNIQRNASSAAGVSHDATADWLGDMATHVGHGYAAAQPLNWMVPLTSQRTPLDPCSARVVLATETTWLRELVEPFVGCASELLASAYPSPPSSTPTPPLAEVDHDSMPQITRHLLTAQPDRKFLLWVYKERGTEASQTFTTWPLVKSEFERRGCRVVTVHREQSGEDEGQWVRVNVVVKSQDGDDQVQW
ncbi:hypothetical protein BCR44DRAFT_36531, partial [Catenaria anguillulae PL171]